MPGKGRLFLLTALFLLLGSGAADGGELSKEERKWAKECIKRVSANSPRARDSAEKALVALGLDGLPLLVDAWSRLDGRAERASLKRVFRGLGPEKVVQALQTMRAGARGSEARRLDELLQDLAPGAPSGASLRVPLVASTEIDGPRLPLGAEHEIGDTLPRALGLGMRRVRPSAGALVVDVDGDGVPEVDVLQSAPRVILFRTGRQLRPVLIRAKLGTWYAASASLLEGELEGRRVRLLDGGLDGTFGGVGDYVQVQGQAYVPIEPPHLLMWGDRLARYEVHVTEQGAALRLALLAEPPGVEIETQRGHRVLNRFRQAVGLQPLRYDAERSKGCREHAEYLAIHLGKAGASLATIDAHAQDRNAQGYTPRGAEAASHSNVSPGPLADAIDRITRTMLHRARWLCLPKETVGLGTTRRGGGWSVVWTGPGHASGDVPVVVPAPGQVDVPLQINREQPVPDAAPAFYDQARGYPVSVTYAPLPLTNVRLALLEADGATPVPGRLFTPETPVAQSAPGNGGSAFFVPDRPLRAGRTLWALFTARRDGRPVRYAWSFRTR